MSEKRMLEPRQERQCSRVVPKKPKLMLQVNCLDPGTVNTKMLLAGWGRIGIEVGEADNTFKLATDPEWAAVTGQYFVGGRMSR